MSSRNSGGPGRRGEQAQRSDHRPLLPYQFDNGWQSIVIETEFGDAQVDKADEKSQRQETYDAMRKTTVSVREAEDQIMEQVNKYTRN